MDPCLPTPGLKSLLKSKEVTIPANAAEIILGEFAKKIF